MRVKRGYYGLWLCLGLIGLVFFQACDNNMGQQLLYRKARSLHDKGKYDEAIEIYQRLLEMPGDHSEVVYDLGVAYADRGDITDAEKQVKILVNSNRLDLADVLKEVIREANKKSVLKKVRNNN